MPRKQTPRKGKAEPADIVVAVCGSGAHTRSLEHLLAHFEPLASVSVAVILQHREALDESGLRRAAADRGRELTTAEDGAPLEAGRICLLPPNVIATIEDDRFRVRPADTKPGSRGTIDSFLVSLAREKGEHTVVVALAGSDGDGTLGIKLVKEAGGLAVAEVNEEAAAGDLAMSASPAALSDAVLPIAELTDRLSDMVRHLADAVQSPADREPEADVRPALASIADILRSKTGHDFHGYKKGTFLRRVQRRMQVRQAERIEDYVEIVRNTPDEAQQLFNDLLIGVTQFFRDPKEFELLEREVIPKLFEGKTRDSHFRVWVVGCSTGEEAYSIAILIREHMAKLDEVPHAQIFATDLDGRALAAARSGRYADDIAKAMSPERLARWFVKEGNTYSVVKELREMCIFSQHSIVKDAPFSRLDLVSCRNLLIYLDAELQSRVVPLFHFALRPGGVLFLGSSENASRHADLFAPVESRSRLFHRVETGRSALPDFPFTAVDRRFVQPPAANRSPLLKSTLTVRAERFAERFAPAYVIVDQDHNVLHFSGRTGRYLDPAGGATSLNLLQLAHPDLRHDMRSALNAAAESNRTAQVESVRMGVNGSERAVDLVVEPVSDRPNAAPSSFIVLFKDSAAQPHAIEPVRAGDDERSQRLESELRTTKERLQATVEELESTNEELKSSNEEYQSLNEELQSANEELETSKEELQSVNEELTTVNGELAHRVQELTRATSDLKNFLESTQIATVFLDNELRVTNYTPSVAEIFHLVESDIGRPIGHIKPRLRYDELQEDARRVLRTLATVERELGNAAGPRYLVRVLPYRSVENFIAGVVVTFVDITARQQAEEARRQSEERFRTIVESVRDYAIFTTDPQGRVEEWLPGAEKVFGWTAEEFAGQDCAQLYTPEDRAAGVPERELAQTRETGSAPNVRWHLRKDGSRVFIEGVGQALRDSDGQLRGVIKIGQDVTERRRSEEALREREGQAKLLLAELQHRVRNTLAVVRSIVRRTGQTSDSVEDFTAHLEGRIDAFARVQAAVTRNPIVGIDLASIVAEELRVARVREEDSLTIEGPTVLLQPKAAEMLGLAVHELTTNAIKHGALAVPDGHIHVGWSLGKVDGAATLDFRWTETGLDGVAVQPKRRGFGTDILTRTLAYELNSQTDLSFQAGGLSCRIVVPAERVLQGSDTKAAAD